MLSGAHFKTTAHLPTTAKCASTEHRIHVSKLGRSEYLGDKNTHQDNSQTIVTSREPWFGVKCNGHSNHHTLSLAQDTKHDCGQS